MPEFILQNLRIPCVKDKDANAHAIKNMSINVKTYKIMFHLWCLLQMLIKHELKVHVILQKVLFKNSKHHQCFVVEIIEVNCMFMFN